MNLEKLYQKKLQTAEEAIAEIPPEANISMGMRVATPPALLTALGKRVESGDIKLLKVYYLRCGDVAMRTIFKEELMDRVKPYSSMLTKLEGALAQKGFEKGKKYINYIPVSFSQYPKTIKQITSLDAFLVTVTPMDRHGYFSLGTNGDYAIELSRYAKRLLVEVNENMPRTAGATSIHISEIDSIVENTTALIEDAQSSSSELDAQIGEHLISHIPNGATIQMGIGMVPNALCSQLIHHKNLGLHTEVITAGMVDLLRKGVITNTEKTLEPYRSVFTFAIGDKALYDFIDDNPAMACLPVSYVNDPLIIAKNKNMISVNAFVEIDFSGQVNAEFISHQFSGVGGQLDFVRGAQFAENGKSFLAATSTAGNGKISRIVPRLNSIATDTRLDVDYVATEYGCHQLRGKSTTERTLALIELAHPSFREELLQQAKKLHFI